MKVLLILLIYPLFLYSQKSKEEIRPAKPINFTDTLIIVKNKYFYKSNKKEVIVFNTKDTSWKCRELSLVHYKPNKKWRKMDSKIITLKEKNKYRLITLKEIKAIYNDGGCNKVESFLIKPTLYILDKEKGICIAYEVLPVVWGAGG